VQIHGAIGMTRDHDVGLYYRRAKAADAICGDADFHVKLGVREEAYRQCNIYSTLEVSIRLFLTI